MPDDGSRIGWWARGSHREHHVTEAPQRKIDDAHGTIARRRLFRVVDDADHGCIGPRGFMRNRRPIGILVPEENCRQRSVDHDGIGWRRASRSSKPRPSTSDIPAASKKPGPTAADVHRAPGTATPRSVVNSWLPSTQ